MNSTWELQEKSTGLLKTTVSGETWTNAQDKAFKKLAANIALPGFRAGKVPTSMAKKHISEQQILIEAIDLVATDALTAAIEEQNLWLIARPEMDIESIDAESVTFVFTCQVKPEVELGEYTNLGIKKDSTRVTKKEIEEQLTALQERFAEMVLKEEGTVENGDTAVIDFEGFRDGIAFDGGKGENYPLVIGSNSFIPGFEEQLIGMASEETKDINVTFPENYHEASLAGAPVVFKVTVHEIKAKELPEVTDELVAQANIENVTTVAEFEAFIKEDMKAYKAKQSEDKYTNDCLTKVCDNAKVAIPDAMIESETDVLVNDFANRLAQQGFSIDQFIQMTGQKMEDIRSQMAIDAENKVKVRLVLDAIATKENIEVKEEDIEAEFNNMAETYKMDVEKIKSLVSAADVSYDLRLRKALEIVKSNKAEK